LRARLAAWAARVVDEMTDARPEMPTGIEDRDADMWEPLLAIADGAGSDWSERAREAAKALVGAARDAEPSLGLRLLADLRIIFDTSTLAALPTATILSRLIDLPESPWGDLHGRAINDRTLAKRLRQYGIRSRTLRSGDATPKGYAKEDLHDAWLRYLPPSNAAEAQQAQQEQQTPENGGFPQGNVADVATSKRNKAPCERNTAPNVADDERNSASERNGNSSAKSSPVADVADVADLRGNGRADDGDPWSSLAIPDFLARTPGEVPPDRRPALGPPGDSLDDFK
jgi:Protein of unknown function (DUF3631)